MQQFLTKKKDKSGMNGSVLRACKLRGVKCGERSSSGKFCILTFKSCRCRLESLSSCSSIVTLSRPCYFAPVLISFAFQTKELTIDKSPADSDVHQRGLVVENARSKDILKEHARCHQESAEEAKFSASNLVYVTPVRSHSSVNMKMTILLFAHLCSFTSVTYCLLVSSGAKTPFLAI